MFGGYQLTFPLLPNDIWVWDGQTWIDRTPSGTLPAGREKLAAAYDRRRDRVVVNGGVITTKGLQDTWEWDGTAWSRYAGAVQPPGRFAHAMAFDEQRGVTLLFGGMTEMGTAGQLLADTWLFTGTAWIQMQPASSPTARHGHCMCFDRKRGRIVLVGGHSAAGLLGDTWEWTGTTWVLTPFTAPAGFGASLVYDSGRERAVLYGGGPNELNPRNDTWEYDGTPWSVRTPKAVPPPLIYHAASFDELRGATLVHGGYDGTLNGVRQETWRYQPVHAGSYVSYAPGCRGQAPTVPQLRSGIGLPYLGAEFTLQVSDVLPATSGLLVFGVSRTAWSGVPLPLDLTGIGMPGCKLASSYELSFAGVADANGVMSWSYLVPGTSVLLGATFHNQSLARDPRANAPGFVMTNACAAQIGAK